MYISADSKLIAASIALRKPFPVLVSWWITPHEFYIQPKDKFDAYTQMMNDMQQFYSTLSPCGNDTVLTIGSYAVCRFEKDQLFYRCCVLDSRTTPLARYKVLLCDSGNRTVVLQKNVWQLAQRFAVLERLAIRCALPQVASYDRTQVEENIDRYLHASHSIVGELLEANDEVDSYFVRIEANGRSLRDSLIADGLVSSTDEEIVVEAPDNNSVVAEVATSTGK